MRGRFLTARQAATVSVMALAIAATSSFAAGGGDRGRSLLDHRPDADLLSAAHVLPVAIGGLLVLVTALVLVGARRYVVSVEPSDRDLRRARAIVARHGEDSLSPFLVADGKALSFAAGGVLSYRVFGETAVVSADPVAPDGRGPEVLQRFLETARENGWRVAVWGASERHLAGYRALGLRAIKVGEEAVVDPQRFTLDGRPVRKLRQSVHRVKRRGWSIEIREGRAIDGALEAQIDLLQERWRAAHPRLRGFAMSGQWPPSPPAPDDVYALARSPDGQLGGVMRFISHCGRLSLDTMHRVGETPNGLNEALVCEVLELARERGVVEVSLNYAGLAHLARGESESHGISRLASRAAIRVARRHFQVDRLVRFNEKFSPQWRPRYLVYESRAALPRTIFRVLEAEGQLPEWAGRGIRRAGRAHRGGMPAGTRSPAAVGEPR